jgi:hypothetical protein
LFLKNAGLYTEVVLNGGGQVEGVEVEPRGQR